MFEPRRLGEPDVAGMTCNLTGYESLDNNVVLNQSSTRAVDDMGPAFHPGTHLFGQHMLG